MSPLFINENTHPVRVPSEPGQVTIPRVGPGQVIEADGYYADQLGRTNGIREATSDEQSEYQDRRQAEHDAAMDPGPALRQAAAEALAPVRQQARMLSVVGPLQRVIGDDTAPFAPPTGTVTTKQAMRRDTDDPRVEAAFGPNEASYMIEGVEPENPLDATVRTAPAIHNAQALNQEAAEAAADRVIDPTGSGMNVGGDPDVSEPVESDYGRQNKMRLQAEATRRGLDVEGSGQDGTVTKPDLVAALEADDQQRSSST